MFTNNRQLGRTVLGSLALSAVFASSLTAFAAPAGLSFSDYVLSLKGRWSGGGQVRLLDGREVEAKCIATYFVGDTGSEVKQNIRCKNDRFELNFSGHGFLDGNAIKGTLTENKYKLEGTFDGNYEAGVMTLSADSRFTGAIITVRSEGCAQSVEIAPKDAEKMGIAAIIGNMRKC